MSTQFSLRRRVFLGSVYLLVRRGLSMLLQIGGVIILSRLLGPDSYGLFYSAQNLHTFLSTIGLMGINVYLIREQQDAPREIFDLAFWWLLGLSILLSGGGALAAASGILIDESLRPIAPFMFALLPLALVRQVPQAMLERKLDYRYTAFLEIGGQLIFYGVGVAMTLVMKNVWVLVVGFAASQIFQTVGYFIATRYMPRWYWQWELLKPMLHFGFVFSLAGWIASVRNLAPAMILLPYVGERAVGYVAMVERLLAPLSFPKEIANRLALPVFARLQNDLPRLRNAMGEAIRLQTLALGAVFAGFALVGAPLLRSLMGGQWDIPLLLQVFSISAARVLISGLFALQGSALAVKKLNWVSLNGNIVFAILLLGGSYLAVTLLPAPYRLFGFLAADFVAFMAAYLYKNYYMARYIGRPSYGVAFLWTVAMLCALGAPILSYWLYLPTAIFLLNPYSVREMRQIYLQMRKARSQQSSESISD